VMHPGQSRIVQLYASSRESRVWGSLPYRCRSTNEAISPTLPESRSMEWVRIGLVQENIVRDARLHRLLPIASDAKHG